MAVPQLREHLGNLLDVEGMRRGVEVGVQRGMFAESLLKRWHSCRSYQLVDLWGAEVESNYADAAGSVDHVKFMSEAQGRMRAFPHVHTSTCRNFSTLCAAAIANESVDFVYLDARHDYWGVLQDLTAFWPKLRTGGVMAGHDFIVAAEHEAWRGHGVNAQGDYALNGDGTRDLWGRAVCGAVDEFFTHCVPRQVAVTYRDGNAYRGHFNPVYSTWIVRK